MANIDETMRKLEEKSKPVSTPVDRESAPPKGLKKEPDTPLRPLPSEEHPSPDEAARQSESVRESNERPVSDPPKPDSNEPFDDFGHSWKEEPPPVSEEFSGLFDNRPDETFVDAPPSPDAPSSNFWADFFEGILLPPLGALTSF